MVRRSHIAFRTVSFFGVIAILISVTSPGAWAGPSVTVANPVSNPALTSSVDDPGRVAYQTTSSMTGKCSGPSCFFSFPPVPAGHRLVVQHLSGTLDFSSAPSQNTVIVDVFVSSPGAIASFFAPFIPEVCLFDQSVQIYVDPGETFLSRRPPAEPEPFPRHRSYNKQLPPSGTCWIARRHHVRP